MQDLVAAEPEPVEEDLRTSASSPDLKPVIRRQEHQKSANTTKTGYRTRPNLSKDGLGYF